MKERSFDEMIAYFNSRVSEMDIAQDYKMELLGMVTALGYKHEQTARRWIPCSERLPEENTPVLLGVRLKDDFKYFVTARMDYNYWTGLGRDIRGELAWMPLPEPYKEDEG